MKLSKWDDYLIHQVVKPMDTLGTDDPNFMKRFSDHAHAGLMPFVEEILRTGKILRGGCPHELRRLNCSQPIEVRQPG